MQKSERNYNMDLMRIVSAFAVVMLHVSSKHINETAVTSNRFFAFNLFNGCVRWAVPVFIMLSGMFMLSPEKKPDLKRLYKKNVLHIATVYLFWSAAYAAIKYCFLKTPLAESVHDFIFGQDFMWFLFIIAALYVFTPFLRKITQDRKSCKYFIIVFFAVTVVLPSVIMFFNTEYNSQIYKLFDEKQEMVKILGVGGFLFCGYYVLGYYLSVCRFTKRQKAIIYTAGIIGMLATVLLTLVYSRTAEKLDYRFYRFFSLNVTMESVGIFVFFNNLKINYSQRAKRILVSASKNTLAIYLIHVMLITLMEKYWIKTTDFNSFISVPLITVLVFAVSCIIAAVMNRIPFVKEYFV